MNGITQIDTSGEKGKPFSKTQIFISKRSVSIVKGRPEKLTRFFDIFFSFLGLVILFPLIVLLSMIIKISSKGPVFFIQERLGQYEVPFKLIKFRTMVNDAEKDGPVWARDNDNRVTFVGKILRRTKLDEIPQLFNIILGDISFVGPRPIRKHFADILRTHHPDYEKRFNVKQGLTGFAQIYAPYGATVEEQLQKLPYDLRYLDGLKLTTYLLLIIKTFTVLFSKDNR